MGKLSFMLLIRPAIQNVQINMFGRNGVVKFNAS